MAHMMFQTSPSSIDRSKNSALTSSIFGSKSRSLGIEQTQLRTMESVKKNSTVRLEALRESPGVLIAEEKPQSSQVAENISDPFKEMKNRFLSFKEDKYLKHTELYQRLAEVQTPKFMVIACGDSRVCPSTILGFQPGDAFVIRNVANLVPPHANGPTETNAALEFAVTALEVENILVVGHSCCGGIRALMTFHDEVNPGSFIGSWVVNAKPARVKTKAIASDINLDQQCKHCEKESINMSLVNLLSYPWIQERVTKGALTIHGGYYDFIDCTFEKWTLNHNDTSSTNNGYSIKDREFWT